MISLQDAFETARAESGNYPISPHPLDLGDCWAFDYDTKEMVNGPLPIIIQKETGKVVPFDFPDDYIRMSKAVRIKK